MITENLSTLKIHKLTQAQYDRELAAGNIDENALYLTPDELVDLNADEILAQVANAYEPKTDALAKLNESKAYTDEQVAIAIEHADNILNGQVDGAHTHDDRYYTEEEIDETVLRIDTSISSLDSRVNGYETQMSALEALAASNQAAIEANAAAIAKKASQEDLDEAIERIAVVETDLASFTEITSNEVQNLFQ